LKAKGNSKEKSLIKSKLHVLSIDFMCVCIYIYLGSVYTPDGIPITNFCVRERSFTVYIGFVGRIRTFIYFSVFTMKEENKTK